MAMLLITPLDYERYVVAHSPLLVPSPEHNVIPAPSREPDPIDPRFTKTYRHGFQFQDNTRLAGAAQVRRTPPSPAPLSSLLSVELSSVAGISLASLTPGKGISETSLRAATERYEQSRNANSPTMRLSA